MRCVKNQAFWPVCHAVIDPFTCGRVQLGARQECTAFRAICPIYYLPIYLTPISPCLPLSLKVTYSPNNSSSLCRTPPTPYLFSLPPLPMSETSSHSSPGSPSGSPRTSHDDHPQLTYDNRHVPDASRLITSLAKAFLPPDTASPLLDVTLRCSDGHTLHANRALLAARSPFFHNLFCSSFAEATSASADLPAINHHILRDVLHYIYTAESPLVHAILSRLRQLSTTSPPSRLSLSRDLHSLVELATAADYLQLSRLQRLCCETLTALFHARPSNSCAVLQAVVTHRDTSLRHCNFRTLWNIALRHPRERLGVVLGRGSPRQLRPPVLDLSADTLDFLLDDATPTNPSIAQAAFAALHAWASRGAPLKRRRVTRARSARTGSGGSGNGGSGSGGSEHRSSGTSGDSGQHDEHEMNEHATANAVESTRWTRARALASKLDTTAFEPDFLLEFAEHTKLLDSSQLLTSFREHAAGAAKARNEARRAKLDMLAARDDACVAHERVEGMTVQLREAKEEIASLREQLASRYSHSHHVSHPPATHATPSYQGGDPYDYDED